MELSMTDRHYTQCPQCHTKFLVPEKQLNNPNAQARCGRCSAKFFVNQHLVAPEEPDLSLSLEADAPASTPKTNTDFDFDDFSLQRESANMPNVSDKDQGISIDLDDDIGLIQDDMLEDAKESQADDSNSDLKDLSVDDLSHLIAEEFNQIHKKPVEETKNPDEDSAWLEGLLSDEPQVSTKPQAESVSSSSPKVDDLSNLLSDYGAGTAAPVDHTPKDYLDKINSRLPQSPTAQQMATKQSPFAVIFWSLGCLLLLVLMVAQYTIFNLDTLIKEQKYMGQLDTICSLASCSLPSADINAFKIVNTSFKESRDPNFFNQTDILAGLENQSTSDAQLYPNLKVSVYQQGGGLLGEFVATPEEYLATPQRLLGKGQVQYFMFVVDVPVEKIERVSIAPFY